MRWLLVIGLALGLVGLGAWRLDTASGQATVTNVVSPSSWVLNGGDFEVRIEIASVTNLGSYEWQLSFNPAVIQFKSATNGPFLGSTGRAGVCELLQAPGKDVNGDTVLTEPEDILVPAGNVRFGCLTIGYEPAGPSGSGLLSTLTFSPVADGVSPLELAWVSLSAPEAHVDIPTQRQGSCIAIGGGATCASPTVAPPTTATPVVAATASPGDTPAPTSTPTPAEPTPIPTPTGPSPTPLPPGLEAVLLVGGCNPVTSSYPDGTPIQTIADAVGPEGNLISLWMWGFDLRGWQAFSPQYPEDSDLKQADLLDVVFACVQSTGAFVRPEV